MRNTSVAPAGFTLIELLITVMISAILMAIALPSMRTFIERKRVEGAASELASDLRYLRSANLQLNNDTEIIFGESDSMTCYMLVSMNKSDSTCDCTRTGTPRCDKGSGGATPMVDLKTVLLPKTDAVSLTSNESSLEFVGNGGMPFNGKEIRVSVKSSLGGEIRVTTNGIGRASICSVSGHEGSFPAC